RADLHRVRAAVPGAGRHPGAVAGRGDPAGRGHGGGRGRAMTGFDDTLLDDPVRLAEADTEARLRAAAMAGAQVRASAEIAREQDLARHLDVDRPRALVLAGRQGTGRAAMRVIASLLAPGCPVPVVVTDVVPNWVGALDVVYAFTADPGDDELAVSLDRAVRYGATVVLTAPPEGP